MSRLRDAASCVFPELGQAVATKEQLENIRGPVKGPVLRMLSSRSCLATAWLILSTNQKPDT